MGSKALLTKIFTLYSSLIRRYPWLFLWLPIFFACLIGSGLRLEKVSTKTGEDVFFPRDAPCLYEKDVLNEQFPIRDNTFLPSQLNNLDLFVTIFYLRKDGGNMLNLTYLYHIKEIHEKFVEINGEGFDFTDSGAMEYSYTQDLCLKYLGGCYDSLKQIKLLIFMLENEGKDHYDVRFYYPTVANTKSKIESFLGQVMGGVDVDEETGRISFVKSLSVIYYLRNEPKAVEHAAVDWSHSVVENLPGIANQIAPDLQVIGMFNNSAEHGMKVTIRRIRQSFFKSYVAVCIFAIIIATTFSRQDCNSGVLSSGRDRSSKIGKCCFGWRIDRASSQYGMIILGLFSTQLGIISAYGSLLYALGAFHSMVTFSIFLVTAVGIDDTFITMNAWQRTGRRLRETLEESGPAITITSLTSVVSFWVSSLTKIEALQLYCIYAALGLLFTYIFQITILPAALFLAEEHSGFRFQYWKYEPPDNSLLICYRDKNRNLKPHLISSDPTNYDNLDKRINSLVNDRTAKSNQLDCNMKVSYYLNHFDPPKTTCFNNVSVKLKNINDDDFGHRHQEQNSGFAANIVQNYYGPFLFHFLTKLAVLVLIFIYLTLSLYGIFTQKIGLEGSALVPEDYHYHEFYYIYRDEYLVKGTPVDVVVNNPPDLSLPEVHDELEQMVQTFENATYVWHKNATRYFLRDYDSFTSSRSTNSEHGDYNYKLRSWVSIGSNMVKYFKDVLFESTTCKFKLFQSEKCPVKLLAFRFRIMLRGIHRFEDRIAAAAEIRSIAARFPNYNITTYHKQWRLVDQQNSVVPGATMTISISIACMALISILAFENVICVIIITLSIISIDIGLIGICSFVGIHLDSVSMVLFTVSIGFSVDYCAHVVYGYCRAKGPSNARALDSLVVMCIPVTQGALSTIVGMLVLVFVKSYVVKVFYVIVFGVAIFGLLHACVFLPVLLSLEDDLKRLLKTISRVV